MQHSGELNHLAEALAKAQGEMENAIKGNTNPHFKSKYADLGSIWDAIRGPLSKHGLSVIQLPDMDDGGVIRVSTMLVHSSGQFIEASYALPAMKNDAQGYGSAITYMKRYALTGMGVAPEDDDGNGAAKGEMITPSDAPAPTVDRKTAVTQWANNAIGMVQQFRTLDALNGWHAGKDAGGFSIRDRIAAVRGVNESLHKRLVDAIAKKSAEFSGVPIAAE